VGDFNLEQWTRTVDEKLSGLEAGQSKILRRQHRLSVLVRGVAAALTRRAAFLIGIGVLIGSALGSSASELVRRLVLTALGSR